MKRNLHSHTQFCDGRATMEEILEAARKSGFTTWGFSPHAPIVIESPCNMKEEDVSLYLKEIERLREKFPDMKIYAGMEVDFLDEARGPASKEVKDWNLDYVIGSVHFIPNQKGVYYDIDGSPERFKRVVHECFEDNLEYVVKTFWKQTQRMIKAGGLDIVGHIDKIALNASYVDPLIETYQYYVQLAEETIQMAIQKGYKIEINTKHREKYGRFFPDPRYWKMILASGIEMPVNSDTHYVEFVEAGMDEAHRLLKKMNDTR